MNERRCRVLRRELVLLSDVDFRQYALGRAVSELGLHQFGRRSPGLELPRVYSRGAWSWCRRREVRRLVLRPHSQRLSATNSRIRIGRRVVEERASSQVRRGLQGGPAAHRSKVVQILILRPRLRDPKEDGLVCEVCCHVLRPQGHLLPGRGLVVVRIDRDLSRIRVHMLRLRGVRPQVAVEAVVLAPDAGAR